MKKTKGISLIVLVVTIIVMIIIAGAIIISLSNTNVIDQAEMAVENHNTSTEKEMLILAYSDYLAAKVDNADVNLQVEGANVSGDATNGWTVEFKNGNKYTISAQGEIKKDEPLTNWKYAWTSDGTTWSDIIKKEELAEGTEVEGKIVAKIYETDEIIDATTISGKNFPEGKGYILDIEGEGEMPSIMGESGSYAAWYYEFIKYISSKTEDSVMPYITKLIIGEKITNIPDMMFGYYCKNLKEVSISNTVTTIGSSAFYEVPICSITIPSSVEVIGNNAFNSCVNLNSVIIEDGVLEIGQYAFSNCTRLNNIIIPQSVVKIGRRAFVSCENLKDVYIETISSEFSVDQEAFKTIADNSTIYVRSETIASALSGKYDTGKTSVSTEYNWIAPAN